MGTRFMCTVEAPIHWNIKEAIVKAQETDTQLVLKGMLIGSGEGSQVNAVVQTVSISCAQVSLLYIC